jgi:hypothetical protein
MPTRTLLLALLIGCLAPSLFAATAEDLNAAFGIPIWSDDSLWDDPAEATAQRLGWPEESRTTTDSSYRKYSGPSEVVLGTHPYSLVLYGESGSVSGISMMFANKGDSVVAAEPGEKNSRDRKRSEKALQEVIQKDAQALESALTAILGQPTADRFGQGSQTRESVKRWDWNGQTILLAAPKNEYVALRILPTPVADLQGKSRITDAVLRERLAGRIEKRPNGDVVLKDIPMVDQGPKGYCVPATWERAMRYMGIPADMYILAMAGDTSAGGGTSIAAIAAGAKEAITRGGRQLATEGGRINILNVKKAISRGLPIMWTVYVDRPFDHSISVRSQERAGMADPKAWKAGLADARKAAKKIPINAMNGHLRLIVGYNEETGEIAFSDSWGAGNEERWMTQEEAQAISQGGYQYINF